MTRLARGRAQALSFVTTTVALVFCRPAAAEDSWFGQDKALHFGVSAALAGGGYAASMLLWEPPWQRATAGALFSLTLGTAKELHDLAGHGDASLRDFAWDVAGTAVGVGVALSLDFLLSPRHEPRREPSPPSTSRQAVLRF